MPLTKVSSGVIAANAVVDSFGTQSITGDKIGLGAITGNTLAPNIINANNIVNASITGAKIALGTITGDDIATGQITGNLLTANCVSGNNIVSSPTITGNVTINGSLGIGGATTPSSGVGIKFPGTQVGSTDANTLDDYEEGTWTATLVCTSGTITLNGANSISRYTKIGRLVNVSGYIEVNAISSPTGRLTLGGLPFSQIATGGAPVGTCYFVTTNSFTGVPWALGNGSTGITIDRNAGTGADSAIDLASAIKSTTEMYFNFTYTT